MKAVLIFVLVASIAITAFPLVIKDIVLDGLQTVSATEVLADAGIEDYKGIEITQALVEDLIKKIFETGYFSSLDPELTPSNGDYVLKIHVKENPVISSWRIELTGPELISLSDLKSVVTLESNKALNMKAVQDSMSALKTKFDEQGYFLVEIGGELVDDEYVFKVTEYAIWDVRFDGETEGIDFSKIRNEIKIDTLRDFYTTPSIIRLFIKDIKRCYPTVEVMSRILSTLGKYVYFGEDTKVDFEKIEIPGVSEKTLILKINVALRKVVEDGTVFDSIRIEGNKLIPTSELMNVITIEESKAVSNADVLNSMQALMDYYSDLGYPMCFVIAQPREGELVLSVKEKYVHDIQFKGLDYTKKYVIDDLITFFPNEALVEQDFYDTSSNLNRTQFFESVNVYPSGSIDATNVDIVVEVKEKEKKFMFGGGITWAPPSEGIEWYNGFLGELNVATINPFGYGQSFTIGGKLGLQSREFSIDYNIRKPVNLPLTLGAQFLYQNQTYDSTSTNIYSLGTNMTTLRIDGHAFGLGVSYENRATDSLRENTLILSANYSYDTRDSALFAMNGQYLLLGVEKAGLLGFLNDRDFWKLKGDLRIFVPIAENMALGFRGMSGAIMADSYKPGAAPETIDYSGLNGVRGMEAASAKAVLLSSAEFRYNPESQTVPMYILGFVDMGGSGDDIFEASRNLDITAGPELDIIVPLLGVMRFGVAYYFTGEWTFDNFKPFFLFGTGF